ncbi:hypothetical protein BOX15_Mlig011942g3 [Macrostomum lignano]|uniref:Uncharacterized protein n=3 Tax=Macrostomum lignano TaxID=282301 RepID=A0A267EWK6_9PLAT|nr:hypothetical protein BOX15_Mlig011942g2 [Macrostomum lignano]PAA65908.1 hypothetical protein BOX15_Mlig011942g1 [Macrostomum lignano]PAA80094.1 hypothetical protein BOX15_Mlig011942g3 [Macrostomum lignano]
MYRTHRTRNFEHVTGAFPMDTAFVTGLSKFKLDSARLRKDDDFADRISHTFTTAIIVVFSLVISCRQYIGKPIACWVPTEFTRAQEEYTENVCWITSTYFINPGNVNYPKDSIERYQQTIGYYQWVPLVLLIQAFLFNLPCLIWRLFNWQSGIQLSNIMEVACDVEMIKDPLSRQTSVRYVAKHIEDSLGSHREYRSGCATKLRQCVAKNCCFFWFGKRYGNFLVCLYLICKACYICNVIGQFFLMNKYLGTNYTFYGLELLRDLAEGRQWEESGNFPRITLCDFYVRRVGANNHRHTVQCVLPINMFNEKIYIFLWFWMILVSVVSISSFMFWIYKSVFRTNRSHFVRKFLKLRNILEPGDKKKSFQFVDEYLRPDGVFILRLIAQNSGELVASEVTEALWLMYKGRCMLSIGLPNDLKEPLPPSAPQVGDRGPGSGRGAAAASAAKRRLPNTHPHAQPLNSIDDDPGEFV